MAKSEEVPLFLKAWTAFLSAHSRVVPRVDQDLEGACGICLVWFDVLQQLSHAPKSRRRMRELADAVLLSKSGLTRLVDRIESAGLVNRANVAGDRRSFYVQLTPAGRRLVMKARKVVRDSVSDHFGEHLSDGELSQLRDALDRVARNLPGMT